MAHGSDYINFDLSPSPPAKVGVAMPAMSTAGQASPAKDDSDWMSADDDDMPEDEMKGKIARK